MKDWHFQPFPPYFILGDEDPFELVLIVVSAASIVSVPDQQLTIIEEQYQDGAILTTGKLVSPKWELMIPKLDPMRSCKLVFLKVIWKGDCGSVVFNVTNPRCEIQLGLISASFELPRVGY
jgi:hypothetical protein